MNYRVIVSTSTDPFVNLALEEYLFRQLPAEQTLLLVYANCATVVIGRNQNPWLECAPASLAQLQIKLARRISGGGTVFHDPGNLNYCFMMPRRDYAPARYLTWVVDALQARQVPAYLSARHDICVAGHKVSGSAFLLTGERALQHGTLLLNADLARLRHALRPAVAAAQMQTHAVASVPSPVANLGTYAPALNVAAAQQMLIAVMQARGAGVESLGEAALRTDPTWQSFLAKQHDWQWRFGRTPAFTQIFTAQWQGMTIQITAKVHAARIQALALALAAPAPAGLDQHLRDLQQHWHQQLYDPAQLAAALTGAAATNPATTTAN